MKTLVIFTGLVVFAGCAGSHKVCVFAPSWQRESQHPASVAKVTTEKINPITVLKQQERPKKTNFAEKPAETKTTSDWFGTANEKWLRLALIGLVALLAVKRGKMSLSMTP